ncbi:MAG: histidinol dehydrogenase [bacterium]
MRLLKTTDKNFKKEFERITRRGESLASGAEETVRKILADLRKKGDKALFEYTRRFDAFKVGPKNVSVTKKEIQEAYRKVPAEDLKALKVAAERIHAFHHRVKLKSWEYKKDGVSLGQRVTPLERVGIYVPGGKAAYPSSVLMNAIPACVAGVDEIVMVSPFLRGEANPYVLVAADLAGVDRIFKVGGAQAVGALAYGTLLVPKVDKIVGPGNIYVALAKRQVFGEVDIDMVAGPSEVVVISDGKVDPFWTAADLLSQAEHDEKASSVLLTWNKKFAEKVVQALEETLKVLPRAAIARRSLKDNGALIVTRDASEAAELSNAIAPEHLELSVDNPRKFMERIRHAGAIFLGHLTTESFGDYLAGPNHVLPTSGTARFASPLSTLDFLKFSSVIDCGPQAVKKLGATVVRLAEMEGLTAHALAMKLRL